MRVKCCTQEQTKYNVLDENTNQECLYSVDSGHCYIAHSISALPSTPKIENYNLGKKSNPSFYSVASILIN